MTKSPGAVDYELYKAAHGVLDGQVGHLLGRETLSLLNTKVDDRVFNAVHLLGHVLRNAVSDDLEA